MIFDNYHMWNYPHDRGEDHEVIIRRFLKNSADEAVTIKSKLISKNSVYEVSKIISEKLLDRPFPLTGEKHDHYHITGLYKGKAVLIQLHITGKYHSDEDEERYNIPDDSVELVMNSDCIIELFITGDHEGINQLLNSIKESITLSDVSIVRWWYKAQHGHGYYSREVFLKAPKTVLNKVFYPKMGMDPREYLQNYLNSDQSLLLLAGDPGTGKTTLLRHLVYDFKLHADVIYDEEALKSDHVFQNFLFDSRSTVLIVEDADNILKAREINQNPLMARFLNVTEGLICFPDKKVIFTTNFDDFNDVDEALRRPGRCFGILHTTPYTYKEAIEVCKFMNWSIPAVDKEYSVAELSHGKPTPERRKLGII